jgi:hypothetical protein
VKIGTNQDGQAVLERRKLSVIVADNEIKSSGVVGKMVGDEILYERQTAEIIDIERSKNAT